MMLAPICNRGLFCFAFVTRDEVFRIDVKIINIELGSRYKRETITAPIANRC